MTKIKILRNGDTGPEVKAFQKNLLKLGYSLGKGGTDGIFGNDTEKALKAFQGSVNILKDGEYGPDSEAMILQKLSGSKPEASFSPSDTLVADALKVAMAQVGVVENPRNSNRGREVEMYLVSIGLGGGYAWCMAYVYWCVDVAAKNLNMINPLYRTGGVLMQWNQRPNLRVTKPQVGDIFIMDFGKGTGHAGFVTKVDGLNIHTVEGNTNRGKSREGDGVYINVRKISSCKGFLRLGN